MRKTGFGFVPFDSQLFAAGTICHLAHSSQPRGSRAARYEEQLHNTLHEHHRVSHRPTVSTSTGETTIILKPKVQLLLASASAKEERWTKVKKKIKY